MKAATQGSLVMTKIQKYILDEIKVIEKECMEKGISPIEWIKRYAEEYRQGYGNVSMSKVVCSKIRRG